jgi:putative transposase
MGFPRFKKKTGRRSFRVTTGAFGVVDDRHIRLPRIGVIRVKEPTVALRDRIDDGSARVLSATVSERAGRWFVSFGCLVQRRDRPPVHPDHVAGVDLGVKSLAVVAAVGPTGAVKTKTVANPKALSRYQRRLHRLQRRLSRQQPGSQRRAASKAKLARCHRKVRNLRADAIHKLTTSLAATYGTIVVEDLHVKGMTASAKGTGRRVKAGLNRAILDTGPGELRRQLDYKTAWRGGTLVVADRWYPSSKTCSRCRTVKTTLSLNERSFRCPRCGLVIDRDTNAANNLASLAEAVGTASGAGTSRDDPTNARGEEKLQAGPASRCSSQNREDGTGTPDKTVTAPRIRVAT